MTKYDSDYEVRLATLEAIGGDTTKQYNSVYDIDLEILRLTEGSAGGDSIEDVQTLPDASLDKNKLIRLASDEKVYISERSTSSEETWAWKPLNTPLQSITYAQLKSLRDNKQLVAGQQYRITDYVTTTAQANTQSAGHRFDIIVTADSEDKLNENARAIQHDGDTYFADCNLNAWELKYCLDNDTDRFAWADTTNGKGVIYSMKDEWNNECPYDFKNIQFKRYPSVQSIVSNDDKIYYYYGEADDGYYKWQYFNLLNKEYLYTVDRNPSVGDTVYDDTEGTVSESSITQIIKAYNVIIPDEESIDYKWLFTFTHYSLEGGVVRDMSIIGNTELYYNEDGMLGQRKLFYGVTNNTIKPALKSADDSLEETTDDECVCYILNNIVFFDDSDETNFYGCYSNTFGRDCLMLHFGSGTYSNTFGNWCQNNTIGNDFGGNTIGNDFNWNTIGNGFNWNTIGNDFGGNTIGNDFNDNTIGNNVNNNNIGNDFNDNTIGNDFNWNTIGNGFYENNIGNDNISSCSFGDSVSYCSITGYTTGSLGQGLNYVTVLSGTHGNWDNKLELSDLTLGVIYSQTCGFDNTGNYTHKNILS